MKTTIKKQIGTAELYKLLRVRYEPQSWALMFEVADATGARHSRWADAVAMSLWPSRGLGLHGIEVKSSRSDWVKELKTPAKAEAICRYCDHWWLCVSDPTIVFAGELPETWGMLAPKGNGLAVIKPAAKLSPEPIDRGFLAALLRSAAKPAVLLDQQAMNAEYSRGYNQGQESGNRSAEYIQKTHNELQQTVRDFEKASGIAIRETWNHTSEKIGQTVREVLAGKHKRDREELQRMKRAAQEIIASIEASESSE